MAFAKEKEEIRANRALWNVIEAINAEYADVGFSNLPGEVIAEYEKNTSKAIGSPPSFDRNEFDFIKYLAGEILEDPSKYEETIERYLSLFEVYLEYKEKILDVFCEKKLYKSKEDCPSNTRSKFISFFMPSDEKRFFELKRYEEELLNERSYSPDFPVVRLYLTRTTPWQFYSRKYTYDMEEIVKSYHIALKKTSQRLFAKRQRALMSDSLRYSILKRDDFRCCICGATQKDGVRLEVDHIIPVSKGGKTKDENLQTLCERCNRGKRNR